MFFQVMFLTAWLWTTALFAVGCDVELKDINPLTALVIPLHEGVRRIIDEYRAGLWSPVSVTTIQSYIKKNQGNCSALMRFKNLSWLEHYPYTKR